MIVRNILPVPGFRPIRKTILSVLIGLMGGGVAVLAQQPTGAGTSTAVASASEVPPVTSTQNTSTQNTTPIASGVSVAMDGAPAPSSDPSQDSKPDASTPAPAATPVSTAAAPKGKVQPVAKKDKKAKKEKAPKLTPISIVQGTLTVDGWTGKARMNYDIADLKYIYMWAPGVGTVVVSNVKFPLGKEEQNAISGNTLTVDANGHTIQLFSEKRLLKDKKPASAWVYVDTGYKVASAYPVLGYGTTIAAPYAWPGAKQVQSAKGGAVLPPPLPPSLRPALANSGCVPAGSKTAGSPCPAISTTPAAPASSTATAAVPVTQNP